MAPKVPRRALISVTSAHAKLHGEHPTGIFISEVMHPYNVFTKAGFEVDLTSETGKYYVDWLSEQPSFLAGADITEWNDVNGEFRQKLDHMPKAETVDASKVSLADMLSEESNADLNQTVWLVLRVGWPCCFAGLSTCHASPKDRKRRVGQRWNCLICVRDSLCIGKRLSC